MLARFVTGFLIGIVVVATFEGLGFPLSNGGNMIMAFVAAIILNTIVAIVQAPDVK